MTWLGLAGQLVGVGLAGGRPDWMVTWLGRSGPGWLAHVGLAGGMGLAGVRLAGRRAGLVWLGLTWLGAGTWLVGYWQALP